MVGWRRHKYIIRSLDTYMWMYVDGTALYSREGTALSFHHHAISTSHLGTRTRAPRRAIRARTRTHCRFASTGPRRPATASSSGAEVLFFGLRRGRAGRWHASPDFYPGSMPAGAAGGALGPKRPSALCTGSSGVTSSGAALHVPRKHALYRRRPGSKGSRLRGDACCAVSPADKDCRRESAAASGTLLEACTPYTHSAFPCPGSAAPAPAPR